MPESPWDGPAPSLPCLTGRRRGRSASPGRTGAARGADRASRAAFRAARDALPGRALLRYSAPMETKLLALARRVLPGTSAVERVERLSGGANNETWSFDAA
ncbi:MAG: hypothetical protein O9972_56875, partial [Burkholderiales bacterium]|nr:hypothetical protein [Burkholderiales bacterium]